MAFLNDKKVLSIVKFDTVINEIKKLDASYDPINNNYSMITVLQKMYDNQLEDAIYITPTSLTIIQYNMTNSDFAKVYGDNIYAGIYFIGEDEGIYKTSDLFMSVDNSMSDTSERPVQNKVVKAYIDNAITGALTEDY